MADLLAKGKDVWRTTVIREETQTTTTGLLFKRERIRKYNGGIKRGGTTHLSKT